MRKENKIHTQDIEQCFNDWVKKRDGIDYTDIGEYDFIDFFYFCYDILIKKLR